MKSHATTHTQQPVPRLQACWSPLWRTLKPLLWVMVAGLSGLAAHAGTCSFTSSGPATCDIPAGVSVVTVVATGGGGGGGSNSGGAGARVEGTLPIVGGPIRLSLFVGGGGRGSSISGGGGGSSNVNAGTPSQIIAGGGGGSGSGGVGGDGGSDGVGDGGGNRGGDGVGGGCCSIGGGSGNGGPGGSGGGGGGHGGGSGSGNGNGGEGGTLKGGGGGGYGGGSSGHRRTNSDLFGGGGGGGSTGGLTTTGTNGGAAGSNGGDGSIVITWIDPVWIDLTTTISPPNSGFVICTSKPVLSGGSSTCFASANPGYSFAAFSVDCTGASCVLSNVTSAKSVAASFVLNATTPISTPTPTSTATPTPPLILPLGNSLPGLPTGGPQLLNMSAGAGPTVIGNVVRVLQNGGIAGLQYVGQSPSGAVVLSTLAGRNMVFAPTGVQENDNRADGVYPLGDGQFQFVVNGVALTATPAVQNINQLLALLPADASASMTSSGVLVANVGGQTYVVQPGAFAQLLANPGGNSVLGLGADGYWHFTDAAGNDQVLYPAFKEPGVLRNILQGMDANATLSIQPDGTAAVVLNGLRYTLVPDLTLGTSPAERTGQSWWQEGPLRYRIVNTQVPLGTRSSQGFTVRP